jgi:two-component system alkaline phosphatase synthesis response regulator PhoP
MVRILIVEDDPKMRKLLAGDLELEGYAVVTAQDGEEGLERAKALQPDLILLDVMMPKMSGYDVCRTLRNEGSDVPILMLTAKGQEAEKVLGLDRGADDYVTKPFGSMELLSRIKALLRRHRRELDKVTQTSFDDVKVNFKRMEATKKGKPIDLTAKEFQILELLIRHRGEVISRQQFLEEVWGYDEMPTTRTVDNQILTLRRKLSPKDPEAYIVTIHSAGYKFVG